MKKRLKDHTHFFHFTQYNSKKRALTLLAVLAGYFFVLEGGIQLGEIKSKG
ncbi:hypothetical protein V2U94_03920 [Paenibacillus polymyxa]|uniref:hypothetical protein n=1 Tax=Paenibacillus polymyxa TaxID=1406 RepID=UPI002ED07649|nr:hypothetical protein [Paenibacillus polymyxa]